MGSTDTGDFFPEGYANDIGFTDGMMGSQQLLTSNKGLPELPGTSCGRPVLANGGRYVMRDHIHGGQREDAKISEDAYG
jgi:hypothetical protein